MSLLLSQIGAPPAVEDLVLPPVLVDETEQEFDEAELDFRVEEPALVQGPVVDEFDLVELEDEQWLQQPLLEDLVVGPVTVDEQDLEDLEEAWNAQILEEPPVVVADFIASVQDPEADGGDLGEADGDELTSTGGSIFEDPPAPATPESEWIVRARRRGRR